MTNIHFLEMIHQFDDSIQTHVLLQLQEETDVASRLVLISYLEMEMPGNRSKDILKLSVFVNQWELGQDLQNLPFLLCWISEEQKPAG